MAIALQPLPPYPSTRARASLTPSQSSTLAQTISNALFQVLSLPDAQISTPATLTFISSYVKDAAQQSLQALVWSTDLNKLSPVERNIRHAVFLLAERLAPLGTLDLQTLVDLSVAYARVSPSRLRALYSAAFVHSPNAPASVEEVHSNALPAFAALLASTNQGLYGLRKMSHIVLSFLRPVPAVVVRTFARSTTFVRTLATAYHAGLASVAQTYGGLTALSSANTQERELDEWERLFLETKVALLDAFHILVQTLLDDVASVAHAGPALAAQAEPSLEVLFGLFNLPAPADGVDGGLAPTPFLNRPLIADYQHAYDFAHTLKDVLRRTEDARADLLEASLREMAASAEGSSESGTRAPGALRLILRSSGVPPGIDNLGRGPAAVKSDTKGKGKDTSAGQRVGRGGAGEEGVPEEQLDLAVAQVLDLLPDQDAAYVRYLLSHSDYPYRGDAERLIGALLEGTAPLQADVDAALARDGGAAASALDVQHDAFVFTRERRNVWDDDVMDLSKVKIGKKSDDADNVLEDRSFIEQMKADILRRAEEISDSEDEAEGGKSRGKAIAFEEELDEEGAIKVRDGDISEEEEEGTDGEEHGGDEVSPPTSRNPETILELAYIQDSKQFDRDAQTRRSKARVDLKAQTGMTDEQIEGWKIMLEKDPKKKEKILAKHEFSGNKPILNAPIAEGSRPASRGGGSGPGGGHGPRGRGRGRGRGGRGGGGGGDGDTARDRAWKERRGNRDRKRGHDKKMARAGGPS
ncbi:hypothetical protein BD309DRAFT_857488 [Dichomitus squalens]|nr:hypothetical protein BD309DRAFT_857488 [Dichomitus squalens]